MVQPVGLHPRELTDVADSSAVAEQPEAQNQSVGVAEGGF